MRLFSCYNAALKIVTRICVHLYARYINSRCDQHIQPSNFTSQKLWIHVVYKMTEPVGQSSHVYAEETRPHRCTTP